MGADIVRIDRPDAPAPNDDFFDLTMRGRRSVGLNLKSPRDRDLALRLAERADALIEGLRPGVMERLGLGPDVVCAKAPKIVYARMTGWGQDGPLASTAGLNYIALSGVLHAIGRKGAPPPPPLNVIADYGGGALYLALGICAALWEARTSGQGRVVDCSIVDGVASMLTPFHGLRAKGAWRDNRESNIIDGGAHYYECYACADGRWIAVGAVEPQFYALLLRLMGLESDARLTEQNNPLLWPAQKSIFAEVFRTRTQREWAAIFDGTDACCTPILSWEEALRHPHNVARAVLAVGVRGRGARAPVHDAMRTVAHVMASVQGRLRDRVNLPSGGRDPCARPRRVLPARWSCDLFGAVWRARCTFGVGNSLLGRSGGSLRPAARRS